jgi:hypothetical protein
MFSEAAVWSHGETHKPESDINEVQYPGTIDLVRSDHGHHLATPLRANTVKA